MQWLGNDEYSQPFHTSSLVGVTEALDEWFDGLSIKECNSSLGTSCQVWVISYVHQCSSVVTGISWSSRKTAIQWERHAFCVALCWAWIESPNQFSSLFQFPQWSATTRTISEELTCWPHVVKCHAMHLKPKAVWGTTWETFAQKSFKILQAWQM